MLVKQLIKYLQTMDPESSVSYGMLYITGMMSFVGKCNPDRAQVILNSDLSSDPTHHTLPTYINDNK